MEGDTSLGAAFRQALRRLAATPCVLAAFSDAGERIGMTATAVSALSLEPASLLASVNRGRSLHRLLTPGRRFSVNLLDDGNAALCLPFAGSAPQGARFDHGEWRDCDGAPCLADAVSFSCAVDAAWDYATHTIIVGRVREVRGAGAGAPVAYAEGGLHRLSPWDA
ncbi:MAG: flavin reductase [Phenylobacterium sp.]|uniref:flavin reductase family protein n=1 Tax=Phenylobacterium sp. TaxID=1871053 RepID=UPI0025F66535|nr:flavin reductase family protein [Phenylobacterium sp.]MBA4013736.1 flavin reductase [Phenylobacterium sp.]